MFGVAQLGPDQGLVSRAEAERLAGSEGAGPRNLNVVWGHGESLGDQRQRNVRLEGLFCRLPRKQPPPREELGERRAWWVGSDSQNSTLS